MPNIPYIPIYNVIDVMKHTIHTPQIQLDYYIEKTYKNE